MMAHASPASIRIGKVWPACPNCESAELEYEFIVDGYPACSCRQCALLFLNPQPAAPTSRPAKNSNEAREVYDVHAANAAGWLDQLQAYTGITSGHLLLVGETPYLETEARRRGFEVSSLLPQDLESGGGPKEEAGTIAACILYRALETAADPLALLRSIRVWLGPNSGLMVIAPTVDSRTARLFRSHWWEFKRDNRFYFSTDTLQCLLIKAGFGDPIIRRDHAVVTVRYMMEKLAAMPRALRYRLLRLALGLAPRFLRDRAFRFLHSRTTVLVRPKPQDDPRPRLSVIVPAYNESATFLTLMDQLVEKELPNLDIEIIIVESNSTDGTREQALRYQDRPRVRLILEDQPRGKGHAVRRGLEAATGDVVLFQDADLEYDLGDYASLVEPILRYQRNFVIGSRHILKGRVWKMRQFNDAAGLAAVFNFGHFVFLSLFNLICFQDLTDPFSMFKVFRRGCLYGLVFECNRFDFDFEIAIKLLRKGYKPLELPVNYRARSFAEGKKVRVFRDSLTFIRALVRSRSSRLYPGNEVE